MKLAFSLSFLCYLLLAPYAGATSFAWMSAKAFLDESDLIAVVDVSSVHEVTTPEGFRLQSANAKIVREIYRRFPPLQKTDKKSIIIYSFDPMAAIGDYKIAGDGFAFPIREGMAFVCLKMKGEEKYYPYEPLCFQSMNSSELISWPAESKYRIGMELYNTVPLSTVIQQIDKLQKEK
jgi:hypothetical protein